LKENEAMSTEFSHCEQDLRSGHAVDCKSVVASYVRFTLFDEIGQSWLIPAQIVETKHKKHQFLVHKSLDLQSDSWMVSHQATSGLVCGENSKERAIELAFNILNGMTLKKFEEHLLKIRAVRKEIEDRAMHAIDKN
jgi:hypothetical protein